MAHHGANVQPEHLFDRLACKLCVAVEAHPRRKPIKCEGGGRREAHLGDNRRVRWPLAPRGHPCVLMQVVPQVRLHVQNRSAVHKVGAAEHERISANLEEPGGAQAYRVRTVRRACGE